MRRACASGFAGVAAAVLLLTGPAGGGQTEPDSGLAPGLASHSGPEAGDPWLGRSAEPDPVLDGLVHRALESSPLLAQARAAAEAGEARVWGAKSAYLPTIGASERFASTDNPPLGFFAILNQGRFSETSNPNDPGVVNDWATQLYARALLFDFGRRRAGLEAAQADADRLRQMEAAARRDVRYAVTAAYHDLLRARAAVHLWQETERLFEAHERLAAGRLDAGEALRSDVLSVRVRLDEARERLLTARHDAELARAQLATVIGVAPESVEVPEHAVGVPAYGQEEAAVMRAARDAHPSILAADAGVQAAEASERAASRGNLPSLRAESFGEWHGESGRVGVERESYFVSVMVDFPFFDGGRTLAARAEARANVRAAQAARRDAGLALEQAARTAHRRAVEALERIAIADRAVAAGQSALAIVTERYDAGMARVVELLETERDVTQARVRALDARTAAWTAVAAVERVAGSEATP